jgi:hypothetical protein
VWGAIDAACDDWETYGAGDTAHYVSMLTGISRWRVRRGVACGKALESLPLISKALADGELGIDKAVELTRFATPETERDLLRWAGRVSAARIREKANLEAKREVAEEWAASTVRSVTGWFHDDGRRYALHADLPASDGALLERELERRAAMLPVLPGEGLDHEARMADALMAIITGEVEDHRRDNDPSGTGRSRAPRATIVVHVTAEALATGQGACELEGDGVISAQAARRLACSGRLVALLEDSSGNPIRLGRSRRDPSAAMVRLLRHRDRECVFPSCGARRFTHPHHIVW